MSISTRLHIGGLFILSLLAAALPAAAAPARRTVFDQRGDFLLIGNTLVHDCGTPTAGRVALGTVAGCGANTDDTSGDVFWRADQPQAGQARADNGIASTGARSTAVLTLPAGATVTYARLYWTAILKAGATADKDVVLDRIGAGAFTANVTADASSTVTATTGNKRTFYQSTADVTATVRTGGSGAYRLSGVDTIEINNLNEPNVVAAWSLVVIYALDSEPPRNLTLFDGLDIVEGDVPAHQVVNIDLTGFLVPAAGFKAKLGVVGYEGDSTLMGDALYFKDLTKRLTNAQNPADNFFNSSRSELGTAVSPAGDLPRLTGTPGSQSGVDIDVVDVTDRLKSGDKTATIRAESTGDLFITGVFVTSISTFKPDFATTDKSYRNVTRSDDTVQPGDELEYTITTTNKGNDPGVKVTLKDVIPAGLTYVAGTLAITDGPNAALKTDAVDLDEADYNAATRTVTVHLGTGATAAEGGTLEVDATTTVRFRVKVDATASGTIANQAVLTATGKSGAPAADYPSDGNGVEPGAQPTSTPIDTCTKDGDCRAPTPFCNKAAHPWSCVECRTGADCPMGTPFCDPTTRTCRGCKTDGDCGGTTPACHPSGRCTQCSMTNVSQCMGATPRCDVAVGTCAGCVTSADCGGTTPVCHPTMKICQGCKTDADCPESAPACQASGACGECSATNARKCVAPRPVCETGAGVCRECVTSATCPPGAPVCDATTRTCRTCGANTECTSPTPICSSGACVGCRSDDDCTGLTPFCSPQSHTCAPCRSDAECAAKDPRFPACNTTGLLAGACTECSATNRDKCRDARPQCLTNLGFCGCSDGDGDSECGAPTSGVVCNAPAGICVPGCSITPGRNGCPPTQTCNAVGAALGACVTPTCLSDGACTLPRPRCDTSAPPGRCVQCLSDNDCSRPYVCDVVGTKTCVECTQTRLENCSPKGAGPLCLTNDTCGCAVDSECGGLTSGRVCDKGLSKCSPGCRGTGGNGCPARFRCTSTDDKIGTCVSLDAGDGGADAAPDAPADTAPDVGTDAPVVVVVDAAPDLLPDARDAAVDRPVDQRRDTAPDLRADTAVADALTPIDQGGFDADPGLGVDGYLAGGGCHCDAGGAARPGGSAGSAMLGLLPLGLVLAVRRRRNRRRAPKP